MSEEETLSFEQLVEQSELDELADAEFLTPREFAKLIGVAPQLVYYYLRTETLQSERCQCGRRVVNVRVSREALQTKARQRGVGVDTRSDEVRAKES